ncbi:MAG: hypothetical protein LBE36_09335 [Flavobacteriaceae bacterium]|nr:hypothetical protein [Flavobacteriaceae bacterium]
MIITSISGIFGFVGLSMELFSYSHSRNRAKRKILFLSLGIVGYFSFITILNGTRAWENMFDSLIHIEDNFWDFYFVLYPNIGALILIILNLKSIKESGKHLLSHQQNENLNAPKSGKTFLEKSGIGGICKSATVFKSLNIIMKIIALSAIVSVISSKAPIFFIPEFIGDTVNDSFSGAMILLGIIISSILSIIGLLMELFSYSKIKTKILYLSLGALVSFPLIFSTSREFKTDVLYFYIELWSGFASLILIIINIILVEKSGK